MTWYDGEKGKDAIEPDKLIEGHLYELYARNAHVGIYGAKMAGGKPGFQIARNKFGYRLDVEYEWEADDKFGTAYAIKDLGKPVVNECYDCRLEFLIGQELKLQMDKHEKYGMLARRYAREEQFAAQEIERIRKLRVPEGTIMGYRGCNNDKTYTCCYRNTEDDTTMCVFCRRPADPDETFIERD